MTPRPESAVTSLWLLWNQGKKVIWCEEGVKQHWENMLKKSKSVRMGS